MAEKTSVQVYNRFCAVLPYKMGLYSIRRIAQNYGGTVEIHDENGKFEILITLSNI